MTTYPNPEFADPEPHGFLYLGFHAEPPQRAPAYRYTSRRRHEGERLTAAANVIERRTDVTSALVFRAHVIPPLRGAPRYDLVMLIRTSRAEDVSGVRYCDDVVELGGDTVLAGVNAARIGDTERIDDGTFLFNHFVVDSDADPVRVWSGLTGWYTAKTGVDNSTALRATEQSAFAFVNYVRLPGSAPAFFANQLFRPSFHTVVRKTLRAHGMRALPGFYECVRAVGE